MSSWYVLGALGLYPVLPGSDEYLVVPPLFSRASLRLGAGAELTIRTHGRGPYVAGLVVNGQRLKRSFLRHAELAGGGEVEIRLSRRPGRSWGRRHEHRPGSSGWSESVVPAPFVARGETVFRDATEVALEVHAADAEIFYTLDESEPVERWSAYASPLTLDESAAIRFVARVGEKTSPIVRAVFHEIPHRWHVTLRTEPLSQYTAGGELALIDGRRGALAWRAGGWQGYQGADFDAVVDLGEVRRVSGAGAGLLRDVRSWIWMPAGLSVDVSIDGESFERVAELGIDVPPDDYTVAIDDRIARFDAVEARFVRIRALSAGPIPKWHPGHGAETILFVDEVFVELVEP